MAGWGKVRPETERLILAALGVGNKPIARAWLFIIGLMRDSDSLTGAASAAFFRSGLEPCQVVTFSMAEMADSLFNHSKGSASKAVRALVNAGVLEEVAKGTRGCSTIYAVLPHGAVMGSQHHTGEANATAQERFAEQGGKVRKTEEMRSHASEETAGQGAAGNHFHNSFYNSFHKEEGTNESEQRLSLDTWPEGVPAHSAIARCPDCGMWGKRHGGHFVCDECGRIFV